MSVLNTLAKEAHYILCVDLPDDDDDAQGMGIIPLHVGDMSPREFRQLLSRYAIKPRQAKLLSRLYAADHAAAEAGLYEPAPPARYVHLQATRSMPMPKDLPL